MLIRCPECEKEVSDKAKICFHCGYSFKKYKVYKEKRIQENYEEDQKTNFDFNSECPVCSKKQWGYNDSRSYIVCQICGYAVSECKTQDNGNKKIAKTIPQMVKELEETSFLNKFSLKKTPEAVNYVKEYFQCNTNIANAVLKSFIEQYDKILVLNQLRCPVCQSINIHRAKTEERTISVRGLDLLNKKNNKKWKCNNCGHTWKKDNNNLTYTNCVIAITIIAIIFLFVNLTVDLMKAFTEPSASELWHQESKEAIDTYNYNHKDDWKKGYKGTRRNSIAEDIELKADGYDPKEYRKQHGY